MNIRELLLKEVLENNFSSTIGNFAVFLFISFILTHLTDAPFILFWLFYMLLVVTIRSWISHNIYHLILNNSYKDFHEKVVMLFIYLTAAGWGALVFLFMDETQPLVNAFILITVTGVIVTSMSTLLPLKNFYYGFVLISTIPVFFTLMQMEDTVYKIFALQVLFFVVYTFKNGFIFNLKMIDNLRLLSRNKKLISDLKKQKNKAEELSELKSQFLANMSHEIRTPLNGMIGFVQILRDREADQKKIEYLDTVLTSSDDLIKIINGILDFSKLEKNKIELEKIKFNPTFDVNQSINLFTENANKKSIQIKLEVINQIPEEVYSDSFRYRQILNNLISNAVKFSSKNSFITIQVEYIYDSNQLKTSVIDHGIGIPADKVNHIFESFTQADSSTTRQFGGTGLGLTICARLVELLGGEIKVDSALGVGSNFSYTIDAPITKSQSNQINEVTHKKNKFNYHHHVLIVEDNIVNQKLLAEYLNQFGLGFDIANDGLEALEAYKNNHYQVILMDENMPNMTGKEATKHIRKMEKDQNIDPIPIIAVTANAMSGDKNKFLEAGMDEYLTKPVSSEDLKQVLSHYLS